jgi:hypothetical protein
VASWLGWERKWERTSRYTPWVDALLRQGQHASAHQQPRPEAGYPPAGTTRIVSRRALRSRSANGTCGPPDTRSPMAWAAALSFRSGDHMINVMDICGDGRLAVLAAPRGHHEGPDPQPRGPACPSHRGPPLIRRVGVPEFLCDQPVPAQRLYACAQVRRIKTHIGLLRVVGCERPTSLTADADRWHAQPWASTPRSHAGAGMLTVAAAVGASDFPGCRHGQWRRRLPAARK